MPTRKSDVTTGELIRVTDFESEDPEYVKWKREKIEAALRHADKHPDDFMTEKEIWNKHGIDY
jgi:hypothetical protein